MSTESRLDLLAGLRARWQVLRGLRSAGRPCVGLLVAVLLLEAVQPALAAAATGALITSLASSNGPAAAEWVPPLLVLAGALLLGQLADLFGSVVRRYTAHRVDGAQRTAITGLTTGVTELTRLEDQAVRDDVLLASARPTSNWTESTPGEAAVAQLRLCLRIVQLVLSGAVLLAYSWYLGLAMIAVVLVVRRILSRCTLEVAQVAAAGVSAARQARYWRERMTAPGEAKEIRVYGLRDWVVEHWRSRYLAYAEPILHKGSQLGPRYWAAFATVAVAGMAAFLALGHWRMNGQVSVGGLGATLSAVISMTALAGSDGEMVTAVGGRPAVTAMERLRARLAPPQGATQAAQRLPAVDAAPASPPAIRFEQVSFRYPNRQQPVLDQLDLEIRPGEVLALVGRNGVGKSTVTKLLCGLYQPDAGRVTVNGADLRSVDPASWRRQLAVVFQDFVHYQLSAARNVGLGAAHADDPDALSAAARDAGSHALIQRLPRGWQTTLSSSFSDGVDLSGGQWQHIALTRALFAVRAGARVLVLDEPTAHLDVRTELEIFRKVVHGLPNVSIVLVSHRLSTVRQADRIACLADGRVIETGSHDELMAAAGFYAELFADQAADRDLLAARPPTADDTE